jgi:hypothetical protein
MFLGKYEPCSYAFLLVNKIITFQSCLLYFLYILLLPFPTYCIVKQSSSTLERANILVKYLYLNLPNILIQNFIAIQTRAN